LFQTSNPAFSNQALHSGVANQVPSSSSGQTSLNKSENWNFSTVSEPSTASLFTIGTLLGLTQRRHRVSA